MTELIAGLDVGTTKICAVIGEVDDEDQIHVLGVGQVESRGMRRGVVVNVAEATAAIGEAVEMAESAAQMPMQSVYVGVAGAHIAATPSRGVVAVGRGRGITVDDVERALEAARTIAIPHNREIIHTLPRSFTVDDQDGIQDPVGMVAYRLEVDAQVITGATTSVQNLIRCIHAHGIEIDDLVLQPLASGMAVLTNAEREMGVALADIGGGTTDIAIFLDDTLWHTVILDVGGNHMTQDVAVGIRAPFKTAEELKVRYGHVLPSRIAPDEELQASLFGDGSVQTVSRRFLAEILEARAAEILELILREVKRSGYDGLLPAGLVLTGGAAQTAGLRELGRDIIQLPVRIGAPNGLGVAELAHPAYATVVGLLLWGLRQRRSHPLRRAATSPLLDRILAWLRTLLPG
ncbi:MAG: cell division protein FtsA [Anaerolineae bacterium]|nr:cell division protein FtsA [Anaerolineae bacterium]